MDCTIDFYGKLKVFAIEIYNKLVNWNLSAKADSEFLFFISRHIAISPKVILLRSFLAKATKSGLYGIIFLIVLYPPLTPPRRGTMRVGF